MSFGSSHTTRVSTREYEIRQAEACDVPRVPCNWNLRAAFRADENQPSSTLRCVAKTEVMPAIHDLPPAISKETHSKVRYDSLVHTERHGTRSLSHPRPDLAKAADSESEHEELSGEGVVVPPGTMHAIKAQEVQTQARPPGSEVTLTEITLQDVDTVPTYETQEYGPDHVCCYRDSCNLNLDLYLGAQLVTSQEHDHSNQVVEHDKPQSLEPITNHGHVLPVANHSNMLASIAPPQGRVRKLYESKRHSSWDADRQAARLVGVRAQVAEAAKRVRETFRN
jgi:hypothetical protein